MKQAEELDRTLENISGQHWAGRQPQTYMGERIREIEAQKLALEGSIQRNLEPYAQAICLHLCKKVLVKLPRELRDLVYEYIVTPDYIYAGPQYLTNTGSPCEIDQYAHFWNPQYVGEIMRIELAQMWYRLSLFYFWDRKRNLEVIERFMTYDRWGLGLKPYEHIARVRFDVGDGIIHHDNDSKRPRPCISEQYKAILTEPFKKLAQFRFPNRVQYLIRIHTLGSLENRCFRGDQLHKTLDEIIFQMKALQSAGHRFRVEWSEIDNLEFASKTCTLSSDAWLEEIRRVSSHEIDFLFIELTKPGYGAPV